VWGLYHGALLIVERGFHRDHTPRSRGAELARRALTTLLVILGWVIFRAAELPDALAMIGHMLLPDFHGLTDVVDAALTNQRLVILILALVILFLPAHPVTGPMLESSRGRVATAMRVTVMTAGLLYSTILIASGTFSPFLYYQF
jgi:alginate O-acetyltransferase complex protein AlgI